jgi:hypothetical protein
VAVAEATASNTTGSCGRGSPRSYGDSAHDTTIDDSRSASGRGAVPPETLLTIEQPMTRRYAFVSKLSQHTACIQATPNSFKRGTKAQPAGDTTPWHSRRIAGAKVEFSLNELETRSKKKAMQAMKIINEQEGITEQATEDYVKLFGKLLTDAHLEAFARLFNWSIPDFLEADPEGTGVVLF